MESFAKFLFGIAAVYFVYFTLAYGTSSGWGELFIALCIGTFSMVIIELLHKIIDVLQNNKEQDNETQE